jgi:hypothetical protein
LNASPKKASSTAPDRGVAILPRRQLTVFLGARFSRFGRA